jgi:hypothetical protein
LSQQHTIYQCVGGPLDGLAYEASGLRLGDVVRLALTTRKVKFSKNYEWPVYDWSSADPTGSALYSVDGPLMRFVRKVKS